ncbi:hypothetical protein [Jiella sonneratiae]|uniref:Uncharacterized protein n=1 Tax=Jiella sonneratiae TaxID=2816856 RepID=A0ABS3IYX6_9HYPH|nr:hypothetical protein [Jiella sonneratiae]MBO0902607.1 hypothetical protein [Jiella sonneratiae]
MRSLLLASAIAFASTVTLGASVEAAEQVGGYVQPVGYYDYDYNQYHHYKPKPKVHYHKPKVKYYKKRKHCWWKTIAVYDGYYKYYKKVRVCG